ncbi:50S ribosomal protein L24 [Halococcus thailandensis]|uniref:Large ribosomal subunit protein uL24 n=1 Tax=Halococcus thailandensis JCM 13552 TaxID=1227457 RepID=M0N5J3_9EURY|nr:50S ribosomal protein L24 [Halococcus thailandensis]EMA53136.1 50S ribosomal protein L24P [Halococcus thailandensis JCM 13552]
MSKQPHKQRTREERAPLHEKHRQVRATLAGDLREEYGRRSARVNAGDTVEVMRGDFAGEEGEVVTVDLQDAVVHVEDITLETADGEDVARALDASNLRITELTLDDDRREARLEGDDE